MAACFIALLAGPVGIALGGLGDAGAGLSYVAISIVLAPVTYCLVRSGVASGRRSSLVALAVLYATLSVLYFQGLDDPTWKSPDPEADAFAATSGALHLLVAVAAGCALALGAAARRGD